MAKQGNTQQIVRCLGFDYGKRRIGVAVGQTFTQQAESLAVVLAQKGVPDWSHIDTLVKQWQPTLFVVGIPLNMDGTTQNMTKAALIFKKNLETRYGIRTDTVDERLTSYTAKQALSARQAKSGSVDAESARLILQDWLDNYNT